MAAAAAEARGRPATGPAATMASTGASASAPTLGVADASDEDFALPPRKKVRPRPGRVQGLTLAQYREQKWGMDAGFRATTKGALPRYTIRTKPEKKARYEAAGLPGTDVLKSFYATTASRGPRWSMGGNTVGGECLFSDASPGPQQYNTPSLMDAKPHATMRKHRGFAFAMDVTVPSKDKTPGPGDYPVPFERLSRTHSAPSYSAQGREAWAEKAGSQGALEPGPGSYQFSHCLETGVMTPNKWTMQGKTDPLERPTGERRLILPGPQTYKTPVCGQPNEHCNKRRNARWKFGSTNRGLIPE